MLKNSSYPESVDEVSYQQQQQQPVSADDQTQHNHVLQTPQQHQQQQEQLLLDPPTNLNNNINPAPSNYDEFVKEEEKQISPSIDPDTKFPKTWPGMTEQPFTPPPPVVEPPPSPPAQPQVQVQVQQPYSPEKVSSPKATTEPVSNFCCCSCIIQ